MAIVVLRTLDICHVLQVTRAALPLGLSDFSSYGYWEAAYQVGGYLERALRLAAVHVMFLQPITQTHCIELLPSNWRAMLPSCCYCRFDPQAGGGEAQEWYTWGPALERFLAAAARLCAPAPSAVGAAGCGQVAGDQKGWQARRVLVAGCGNSALGYHMWERVSWQSQSRTCSGTHHVQGSA